MALPKTKPEDVEEKPEVKETSLDEARETPEKQAEEVASGEEEHGTVPLTEEFQLQVMDLVKSATKEECSFIQDLCSERRQELYKQEEEPSMDDFEAAKE